MYFYWVRHGETLSNAEGRIQGQLDTPLSPLGEQQAVAVAQAFAATPVDAIFSSPLRRALDTANVIGDALRLPVQTEPQLMEINAGIFQGLTWAEIGARYPNEMVRWRSHDPDFCIPGGESRRDLMQRAGAAMKHLRGHGFERVVVVAHGGLLSAALKSLLEIPAQRNPFHLQNGSISLIQWKDDPRLISLNRVDHLGDALSGGGDL